MKKDPKLYTAESYLEMWGEYIRKANSTGLLIPSTNSVYKHVAPSDQSTGEEPEGFTTMSRIYKAMRDPILQTVIWVRYATDAYTNQKAAAKLEMSNEKFRVKLKEAHQYVAGALDHIN